MQNKDLVIKKLNIDSCDEQLELYNLVFFENRNIDWWINKHYRNPLLKGNCFVYGVYMKNKLAGMNCFMPIKYNYNNRNIIEALQSCDTAVAPDYRGMGIFKKIIEYAMEDNKEGNYDLMIGYPNSKSIGGFLKAGWVEVRRIDTAFYISNIRNFVKVYFNIDIKKAGLLFDRLKESCINHYSSNVKIETVEGILENIGFNSKSNSINTKITNEEFKWRNYNSNLLVCKSENDKCIVECVFRIEKIDRVVIFDILSIRSTGNKVKDIKKCLASIVTNYFSEVDVYKVWLPLEKKVHQSILSLGFQKRRKKNSIPLLVYPLNDNIKTEKEYIFEGCNWDNSKIEIDTIL